MATDGGTFVGADLFSRALIATFEADRALMHALHEVALGVSRGWKIQAFEFSVTATMSVIFPLPFFWACLRLRVLVKEKRVADYG